MLSSKPQLDTTYNVWYSNGHMVQKDREISLPEAVYVHYAWHPTEGSNKGWVTLADKGVNEIRYYWMENLNNADLTNERDRFDIADLIAEARVRATLELKVGPAIDIQHSTENRSLYMRNRGIGIYLFSAANVKELALKYPSFHSHESYPHDILSSGGLLEAIRRLDIIFELRKGRFGAYRFPGEFKKALENIPYSS